MNRDKKPFTKSDNMHYYLQTASTRVKLYMGYTQYVVDDEDMPFTYKLEKLTQVDPEDPKPIGDEDRPAPETDEDGNEVTVTDHILKISMECQNHNHKQLEMFKRMNPLADGKTITKNLNLKYVRVKW